MTLIEYCAKIHIDRKIVQVLSCICCVSCKQRGEIALRANIIKDIIEAGLGNIEQLTIGEALALKQIFGLSNIEATHVFLGGTNNENIQV